jgi:cytochrome P450/4-hydroxybenzoate polyprenyltransferase
LPLAARLKIRFKTLDEFNTRDIAPLGRRGSVTLMARATLKPAAFLRPLATLGSIVRWREWYDSKLPLFLVAMFYAVLRTGAIDAAHLRQMAALFVLLCLYAAFGHIINDYADRAADRDAGKRKVLAAWSEPAARLAVAIPCVGALVIAWLAFAFPAFGLTVLAFLLATLYSLPPVRLKERGLLGWAAAALAQRTLPVAIVFQAFGIWDMVAWGFVVLNTLIGLRFIIVHQLLDRGNDQRAGVRTVATQSDPRNLVSVLRRLFALEIICACAVVGAMAYNTTPLLGGTALAYASVLAVLAWRGRTISPLAYFVFYGFYCVIWPIALALSLALHNSLYVSVLCVAAALVQRHARLRFRAAFLKPVNALGPALPARLPRSGQTEKLSITKADPYPYYAQLRDTAAVVRVSWPGLERTTWLVTRHQQALTAFKDPRFVRGAPSVTSGDVTRPRPMRGLGPDLLELDPPDHTRLRKLVSLAFTPRMVQRFERRIEELADDILARAVPRGEIELISEYAAVLPIVTISALLGVPIDNVQKTRDFLHALSLNGMMGNGMTPREAAHVAAWRGRFTSDLEAVFAARRATPEDDLVTALVQAEQDGDRLSHDELIGMVYLLLLAGFMTTVNLIGNGMLALLRHPDQLDMLRRNPALSDTAVEELLRYDSPLELSSVCFAATDIELDGTLIPMAAPVRVLIPSANRDERVFSDPDTLDITRAPCPHVSFGQGIHHCLGAPLARLEGKIALRKLLERVPNPRLSDRARVAWLPHPILRGLHQLPLRF